jgi:hypothetical protein
MEVVWSLYLTFGLMAVTNVSQKGIFLILLKL